MLEWLREGGKAAAAVVVGSAVALILGLIVAGMWIFGVGWFSNATANFRGNVGVQNKTKANASFRIAAYDHFFDLCAGIQGKERALAAQRAIYNATPKNDTYDRQRILTNIAAIQGSRDGDIAQYNQDARKSYTEGQFRASALPFQLDPEAKETSCIG